MLSVRFEPKPLVSDKELVKRTKMALEKEFGGFYEFVVLNID